MSDCENGSFLEFSEENIANGCRISSESDTALCDCSRKSSIDFEDVEMDTCFPDLSIKRLSVWVSMIIRIIDTHPLQYFMLMFDADTVDLLTIEIIK